MRLLHVSIQKLDKHTRLLLPDIQKLAKHVRLLHFAIQNCHEHMRLSHPAIQKLNKHMRLLHFAIQGWKYEPCKKSSKWALGHIWLQSGICKCNLCTEKYTFWRPSIFPKSEHSKNPSNEHLVTFGFQVAFASITYVLKNTVSEGPPFSPNMRFSTSEVQTFCLNLQKSSKWALTWSHVAPKWHLQV